MQSEQCSYSISQLGSHGLQDLQLLYAHKGWYVHELCARAEVFAH